MSKVGMKSSIVKSKSYIKNIATTSIRLIELRTAFKHFAEVSTIEYEKKFFHELFSYISNFQIDYMTGQSIIRAIAMEQDIPIAEFYEILADKISQDDENEIEVMKARTIFLLILSNYQSSHDKEEQLL